MGQGSKNCKVPSHQLLKDKAKNRVEDLQLMLNELQLAREECRVGDAATLEEQVNQILQDWKAELDQPTPASSLLVCILTSLANSSSSASSKQRVIPDVICRKTALVHSPRSLIACCDSARNKMMQRANSQLLGMPLINLQQLNLH